MTAATATHTARRARTPMHALAIATTMAALLACGTGKKPAPAAAEPASAAAGSADAAPDQQAASVKTPWVKARNTEDVAMLEAPATVLATPESNAGVSPPFRARIVRVRVKPGEKIHRGDPVADVVMPELVQAAGTYASAATRVAAYERRAAQLDALKADGMVRLSELLDVQTKLAEARADQQSALAMLRVGGLDAAGAETLLATKGAEVPLRSPIDGTVTQVRAAIGENREAAGEPLVRIAGEGEPRIEARVARLLPQSAEYEIWLHTGETQPVALVGRAPQVDPRDGTTLVWFAPKPGTRLVQGQTCKIKIRLEEEGGAVAIPARAVGLGADGPFVVKLVDGKPRITKVTVIAASGSDALVKGDVGIGEEVAAEAAQTDAGAAAEAARPPPPDQDPPSKESKEPEEAAR